MGQKTRINENNEYIDNFVEETVLDVVDSVADNSDVSENVVLHVTNVSALKKQVCFAEFNLVGACKLGDKCIKSQKQKILFLMFTKELLIL